MDLNNSKSIIILFKSLSNILTENHIQILNEIQKEWLNCIKSGFLDKCKYLFQLSKDINYPIDIHINNDEAFRISCENGHLDICKWLYNISMEKKSPINMDIIFEEAFFTSYKNKHYGISKWLYNLK